MKILDIQFQENRAYNVRAGRRRVMSKLTVAFQDCGTALYSCTAFRWTHKDC